MKEKDIYLAAGCFWGAEHYLKLIEGVCFTEVGYANGNTQDPSYEEVYTDTTGFAETVHVQYDAEKIPLTTLLHFYLKAIDPTSLNKQGNDSGTRYRTGIYYVNQDDYSIIQSVMNEASKQYSQPICVEVLPLKNFYRAEEYHQDYLDKNPSGYCHLSPELFEFAKTHKVDDLF